MTRGWARAVVLGSLLLGAVALGRTHMRWMSGRKDLTGVKGCWTCHAGKHPAWKTPRPAHAAPAALAVSPDGARLFVALDEVDAVAVVDTATLAEQGSVPVGKGPVGLALVATSAGERLVVANSVGNDLSVLSTAPLAETARLAAGREPYAVAEGPDGTALVVARMAGLARGDEVPAAETTVVDAAAGRVVRRIRMESAHLSEGVALSGAAALVPVVRVRNLVPITQVAQGWVVSSGLAKVDPRSGEVVELPLDEANAYYADPSGIAVDPKAKRAYVASGGGDAVSAVDLSRLEAWIAGAGEAARRDAVDDLQLSGEYVAARVPTGRNPRQLALSPDGGTLFVAERLDDSVLFLDTKTLEPKGRVKLQEGAADDPYRRGEVVFARAKTTFQAQFSCRSCHPDGHVDGLAYDFDIDGAGKDILDNRSLQGLSGTAPFKWNGKNATLKIQCGPRFAKVLTRAAPFTDGDVTDLDTFLLSLPPTRTGFETNGTLTEAQERGKKLFFATRTTDGRVIPYSLRCSTCHRPPLTTDRLPADVGSRGPHDSTSRFDTPHLLGIAASAPYLHDGRASTLEEIWTLFNPHDTHGVTNYMNKIQLNDLIEYLKTL